jgi:hypothetical protein
LMASETRPTKSSDANATLPMSPAMARKPIFVCGVEPCWKLCLGTVSFLPFYGEIEAVLKAYIFDFLRSVLLGSESRSG